MNALFIMHHSRTVIHQAHFLAVNLLTYNYDILQKTVAVSVIYWMFIHFRWLRLTHIFQHGIPSVCACMFCPVSNSSNLKGKERC